MPSDPLPEPIYIDRLREAVDLALFDAEVGHSHPACRATFRRVAMAAFDAEAAAIMDRPYGRDADTNEWQERDE